MNYIVIEAFPYECPFIVTNEDGEVKIFDNMFDAQEEANDCQDGRVIEYPL